jgi:magnesium-transporting ATPase (P-type)
MSVVVRLQSGRLVLMCKGADNVIIDRCAAFYTMAISTSFHPLAYP